MHNLQLLQLGVDALDGEAHHIVVAAIEAGDADIAYPLLNAVGAGLVEGAIGLSLLLGYKLSHIAYGNVAKEKDLSLRQVFFIY